MNRLHLAALTLALAACGTDGADSFRDGFPRSTTVKFDLPEKGAAPQKSGQRSDGLLGERAAFYSFTRDVTVTVNGTVVATLELVERIVESRPSALSEDAAMWGPHTDPLSPNTFRFGVRRVAPNEYEYALEAKGKSEPDTAYRRILAGRHVSSGKDHGNGVFAVDWSLAQQLPEHDAMVGQGEFAYSHVTPGSEVRVDANLFKVRDGETGQLVDVRYGYRATPGQGGSLDFQLNKDLVAGAKVELLVVRSRWAQTGAGRSDATVSGGEVPGEATINECWDADFLSRYFAVSFDPSLGWGEPSSCVYGAAEYVAVR